MKIGGKGKAKLIDRKDFIRIVESLKNPRHKLIFLIGAYTAERWGAIRQLKITDVYDRTDDGWIVRSHLNFDKKTRKGKKDNRQVAIHPELQRALEAYTLPANSEYLFPSLQNPDKPITHDACDDYLRKTLTKLGIVGVSTHSTRRTSITNFYRQSGGKIAETRHFSGHKNNQVLVNHYIEVDSNDIDRTTRNLVPCI
jgi:integrase/recombinase XerD